MYYYTIESEGLQERKIFLEYRNACMAAWEVARRTGREVWVIRQTTPSGLGKQILCVYNCKYEVSSGPDSASYEE